MIRRVLFVFLVVLAFPSSKIHAYNSTGHKVVASICFRQLNATQRSQVIAILKKHPRFNEDFRDMMPNDISNADEDTRNEWLFQQAAIWPDLVKSGPSSRTAFNRARWHFVNVPHYLTDADRDELEDHVDVNLADAPPATQFLE